MTATALTYERVICTRNRPDSLRLSIPALIRQTRPPVRTVTANSSDDYEVLRQTVDEVSPDQNCQIRLVRGPACLAAQRNAGLSLVQTPIVPFAADDAPFDQDCAEHILDVCEYDVDGRVGSVDGAPRTRPKERIRATSAARSHRSEPCARELYINECRSRTCPSHVL
jgi:hypothetical protein